MQYTVKTTFEKHRIIQECGFDDLDCDFGNIRSNMSRQIINLKEAGVREALVKLGWTPPKE